MHKDLDKIIKRHRMETGDGVYTTVLENALYEMKMA